MNVSSLNRDLSTWHVIFIIPAPYDLQIKHWFSLYNRRDKVSVAFNEFDRLKNLISL